MLDRNELAALKSIADDLAAYTAKAEIDIEAREQAERKFQQLMQDGTGWTKTRNHYA